jgi:hypothetical protein
MSSLYEQWTADAVIYEHHPQKQEEELVRMYY